MKIVSWNINGIRAMVRRGIAPACCHYTRTSSVSRKRGCKPGQITLDLPEYPYHYWNGADKSGYAGTAILSKTAPLSVRPHIGVDCHDHEGRVIAAEFPSFFVVSVYVPNAKRDLSRLADRQDWDGCFLAHLKTLERDKPVVCGGDFQRCHTPIDLASPEGKRQDTRLYSRRTGRLPVLHERRFYRYVSASASGPTGHYTWWRQFGGARERNVGWRIDYLLISAALLPCLTSATILSEVYGSDHCPVAIELLPWWARGTLCVATCLYHGCPLTDTVLIALPAC